MTDRRRCVLLFLVMKNPIARLLTRLVPFALSSLALAAPQEALEVRRSAGLSEILGPDGQTLHATSLEVSATRWIEVESSDVRVVHWTQRGADGSLSDRYRVSFDGQPFSRERAARYDLELVGASIDTSQAPGSLTGTNASGVFIVQFHTQSLAAYRSALEALGARVHQFLPYQAQLVRLAPAQVEGVRALPFVRWVGPYQADYRIEPYLLERLDSGVLASDLRYRIQLFEKGPARKAEVARQIRALPAQVVAEIPDGYILEAILTPAQVRTVAALDEVLWIDRWMANENDMNIVRNDGGANVLEGLTGFTGQGVRGECFDGNVLLTHSDFQSNPIIAHGPLVGDMSHGTPVTGIVFGDGTGASSARGLLPDGQPIFADNGQFSNRYAHTAQLLAPPYEAVFQTNSWGSGLTRAYNSFSSEMDDIIFDHDILITQSQSNAGNRDSRPQAWAKNIVSVGGIRHRNTLTKSDDVWQQAGSIGLAADGRIKPDLCHWYEDIRTTSSGGAYTQFGGTSAATPITAGYFGLFFQLWHNGVFGNPTGATVFASRPHSTTARAFVINNAEQYPIQSAGDDLGRRKQGWGRANVENIYERRDKTFYIDESDPLTNLAQRTYDLEVEAGEPALRATLVYIEPAGTTSAAVHRINDLTLRVSAPDGTLYWGNNGMKTGNWTTPGGSPTDLDPVENVFVENPQPGVWSVSVLADEVNVDTHLETPELDADFALVVTGTTGLADCAQPLPTCATAPNSVGPGALLAATGSASLAANDLVLSGSGLPPNRTTLFFYGTTSVQVPLGDGNRCAGGSIVRFPLSTSSPAGSVDLVFDAAAAGLSPGDESYFQCWYRDGGGPGGTGSNLSDAIQVEWCQ